MGNKTRPKCTLGDFYMGMGEEKYFNCIFVRITSLIKTDIDEKTSSADSE